MQWEYKTIAFIDLDKDKALNELGADGWDLVSVTTETEMSYAVAYLKRPRRGENYQAILSSEVVDLVLDV